MSAGIYQVVSGARVQAQRLEVIANDLANVSTPGFKGGRMAFAAVLSGVQPPAPAPPSISVSAAEVRLDLSDGPLKPTGQPLDLALEGPGMIAVEQPGGRVAYSRAGALRLDSDGTLRDPSGGRVLDEAGKPLKVPAGEGPVRVDATGNVLRGGSTAGRLKLVEFARPRQLTRLGARLYDGRAAGPREASGTRVRQGYLEGSNVNAIAGVTRMISTTRAYEALHRVLATFREMDSRAATAIARQA